MPKGLIITRVEELFYGRLEGLRSFFVVLWGGLRKSVCWDYNAMGCLGLLLDCIV